MARLTFGIAAWGALATLTLPLTAGAALGNLTYEPPELGKPIATFSEATFTGPPGGSNTVVMLRDHMLVMGSHDSGKPDGPLHVFDVSNPRAPVLLKRFTSPETALLRELHAMPVAMLDGKDFLVMPTTTGLQFFDFTDPLNPTAVSTLPLTGVNAGDYDNAAWMVSWAWPYVYVGGTGNGIYVVDATDPSKPTLLTRVETGNLGGFRVGPVYAAGNYIIASGMDGKPTKVSVLDASDPANPFLSASASAPASMYSTVVIGDRIYGSGENGQYSFMKWSPEKVEVIGGALTMGSDKGGYCTYQDAFIFCGQSGEGYRKIDVSDETNFHEVATANLTASGSDTDFATVLGNLVYLGNDHGSGAAFLPHDMAPDSKPPKFLAAYPGNGELNQALTSRITLFFSDQIDLGSITAESVIVRPVDGAPLDGVFSYSSFNAVSFGAKAPLSANTTYEVVIVKSGLKDLAKNPIAEDTVVRFSTGDTIQEPIGGGGSPNMGGSGGSGTGGASGGTSASGSASGGQATAGSNAMNGAGTAAATPPTTVTEAGCGCSVPGQPSSRDSWAVLGLAAATLAAGARRRRSRESQSCT